MLHALEYYGLYHVVCNVDCHWVREHHHEKVKEVADDYDRIFLGHLSNYYSLCNVITIGIVRDFGEGDVNQANGSQSDCYQPMEALFGLAGLHYGKNRANSLVSCVAHAQHYREVILVEGCVPRSRVVIVLLDFNRVEVQDSGHHRDYDTPTVDVPISEGFKCPNPHCGSEEDNGDQDEPPYINIFLEQHLGEVLKRDGHESQHGERKGEVQYSKHYLEVKASCLSVSILDEVGVVVYSNLVSNTTQLYRHSCFEKAHENQYKRTKKPSSILEAYGYGKYTDGRVSLYNGKVASQLAHLVPLFALGINGSLLDSQHALPFFF